MCIVVKMVLIQIYTCVCGGISRIVTDGMEESFVEACICLDPLEFSLVMEFDTQGNGGQIIPGEMIMDADDEDSGVEEGNEEELELEERCLSDEEHDSNRT